MFTESVIQQIESALGKRHPQADALIWQRVDFICKEIKGLKSRRTMRAADGANAPRVVEVLNLESGELEDVAVC